jgi:hypothetical protein
MMSWEVLNEVRNTQTIGKTIARLVTMRTTCRRTV